MSRKRILFVDDEPRLLEGLQNLLRKQRTVWDMTFVTSGAAALEALAGTPFDMVVSDMQMPGMDGASLLRRVRDEHPSVARIVLSGHAERAAVMSALPVAHQYLSKPCDAALLRGVIERTCQLQELLDAPAIRVLVNRLDRLPSVPQSYLDLTALLAGDDVNVRDVASVIEAEPAMAAKVLQLVNSAYFGFVQPVTSIQQSVMYLGVESLRALVLTAHVFDGSHQPVIGGLPLDRLRQHSVLTARLAKTMIADRRRSEEAFAAGIIHDIGKIVLAIGFPGTRPERVGSKPVTRAQADDIERDTFGVTHAEVGAYLLGAWGLPFSIVEAVAFHHRPGLVTEGVRDVLAAVHLADALTKRATGGLGSDPCDEDIDLAFLEAVGFSSRVDEWRALATEMASAPVHAGAGSRR